MHRDNYPGLDGVDYLLGNLGIDSKGTTNGDNKDIDMDFAHPNQVVRITDMKLWAAANGSLTEYTQLNRYSSRGVAEQ